MAYTLYNYAQALAELLEKASSEAEIDRILSRAQDIVRNSGDDRRWPRILEATQGEILKRSGRRAITIETAQSRPSIKKELQPILEKDDYIEMKINKELLAGVRVTIDGEEQLDASWQGKIKRLLG